MRGSLNLRAAKTISVRGGNKPIPRADKTTCKTPYDDDPSSNVHLINQFKHQTFGKIYAEDIGPDVQVVCIADPNICQKIFKKEGPHPLHLVPRPWQLFNEKYKVKRGLLFLDGTEWSHARRKLNKFFFTQDAGHRAGENATARFVKHIASTCQGDRWTTIDDIEAKLEAWSVQCSLDHFFGSNATQMTKESITSLVSSVKNVFKASAELQFLSADKEADANSESWQRFCNSANAALARARIMTDQSVALREEGSLVQEMLKVFSLDEVVPILVDLIIAATNTTSTSALATLHQISRDAVHQEAIRSKPMYARWCIREAMRMYPVAPFITRILTDDFDPGEDWQKIPTGTLVLLSTYTMSFDDKNFPCANKFWPGRFARSDTGRLIGVNEPFASLPFGHGPRSCIGRQVAMDNMMLLITSMVKTLDLRSLNEYPAELTMRYVGCPDREVLISCRRRR